MRVAFIAVLDRGWLGGVNYLRNLLDVLRAHAPGVTPVLFHGPDADRALLAELPDAERVETPLLVKSALMGRALRAVARGSDRGLAALFAARGIDRVFETRVFLGARFPVPALAWYPDFQHRRLPQLFSAVERMKRDVQVGMLVRAGRMLMLSSRDAEADAHRFFPRSRGRTAVVPFAIPHRAAPSAATIAETLGRHGLSHYVFLPNQFWRHKNHEIVVEALGRLPAGRRPIVAATGAAADPRDPGRFDRLVARAAELGVPEFRTLGVVPYADIGVLMAGAQALLNPSRFEGWSTTVEEAKAAGVPLLLADIAVHREQAGGDARYFGVDDPDALAALLAEVAAGAALPAPDAGRADARAAAFARAFEEALARA